MGTSRGCHWWRFDWFAVVVNTGLVNFTQEEMSSKEEMSWCLFFFFFISSFMAHLFRCAAAEASQDLNKFETSYHTWFLVDRNDNWASLIHKTNVLSFFFFLIREPSVNPDRFEGSSAILTIIVIVVVAIIDSYSSAVSPLAIFHYTLSKEQKWQWGIVGFFSLPSFAKIESIQEIVSLRSYATHLHIALSSHLASSILAVVDF